MSEKPKPSHVLTLSQEASDRLTALLNETSDGETIWNFLSKARLEADEIVEAVVPASKGN